MWQKLNIRRLTTVMMALVVLSSPLLAGRLDGVIAQPGDPHGLIITSVSQTGKLVFPVEIYSIDDRRVNFRDLGVLLTPGKHTLRARSVVSRDHIPGLRRDITRPNRDPIEIDIVAGKTYYLGMKADSSRGADWELIVWKVEDSKT